MGVSKCLTIDGLLLCVTACRISYQFGLKGPSMSVDTACSSSLVATGLARQALTQPSAAASATSALVGGINMLLLPATTAMFQRAGMLAPDGRCKALDAAADGYVRAEAAAMMLIGVDDGHGGPALAVLAGKQAVTLCGCHGNHMNSGLLLCLPLFCCATANILATCMVRHRQCC